MKTTLEEFRQNPKKRITLMGMSGVGKTRLANILRATDWFHYSVDYRIGTRYLDEAILDNLKSQMMNVPFLKELLRSDSIYIRNNITFDNLAPLSSWLGMLGDPDKGGLPLSEFKHRQGLHLDAERRAVRDTVEFINKSETIYGYQHFLNDVSGSLCELADPALFQMLADNTIILYLQADQQDEEMLIQRAAMHPKPLYYREAFLQQALADYQAEKGLEYVTQIDPADFVTWVFPQLFRSRVPRYEFIASQYGYCVAARDAFNVSNEKEFLQLAEHAIAESENGSGKSAQEDC